MELFFMMTAMLALLGPIAVGRVRCIRIAPRLHKLVANILPAESRTNRAVLDASEFAGQVGRATLHIYATAALRRLRRRAGVRSSMKTSVGWLARPRFFSRNLSAG